MYNKHYLFLDFSFPSSNVLPIYPSKLRLQISISWKFLSDIRFLQFLLSFPLIFSPTLSKTRLVYRIFIRHYPKYQEVFLYIFLSFDPFFFRTGKEEEEEEKTHGKRGFYERDFDEINPENDESPGQALFSSISLWGKGGEFYGGLAMERR